MVSYISIRDRLKMDKDLPVTPDWSAAADFVQLIADHCLRSKPAVIVECSSGLTTVALARCCQLNGLGHVYSLENGKEYADKTHSALEEHGLGAFAAVLHVPLEKRIIQGVAYEWYGTNNLPEHLINMLVIDGPSGFIQRHSRYPALPVLFDRLADGCVVIMDDAGREDEKAIVNMWQSEFPLIEHDYIDLERGCSILTIHK